MQDSSQQETPRRSGTLLVALGTLWLLLAAALLGYELLSPPQVEITWETATEQNTAGFNLYRSQAADGEFILVNEDAFIASEGDAVSGASYAYTDSAVSAGATYYYVLEEIETDGSLIRFEEDLFEYTVPGTTWWVLGLAIVSAVVGLAMITVGRREN